MSYMLRDLAITPVRFRVKDGKGKRGTPGNNPSAEIAAYVQAHPGAGVNDLRTHVSALDNWSYDKVRALLVRLVEKGVLALDGHLPLESVDLRYERVPACDLCGSPSSGHSIVLWKHNTPVVRCRQCGLLYANPRWQAEHLFGRYTDVYWAHYADKVRHTALDPTTNQARWDPYLATLELARSTGRLLDVGCASGEFLLAAQARGWEVYGLETSPLGAELARQRTGAEIYVGTLDTAPYEEGWFDVITLWDVIEHVQSPSSYVGLITRLVRQGGMFALTTPNIRSMAYKLLGRNWEVVGPNDHIYYFSPRTLTRLLKTNSFDVHVMHTTAVEAATWRAWLRHPIPQKLAPSLRTVTLPITNRLLLGDELYVVARRL